MPPKTNKKKNNKNNNKKVKGQLLAEALKNENISTDTFANNFQEFGEKFLPGQTGSKSFLNKEPPIQNLIQRKFITRVTNVTIDNNIIEITFKCHRKQPNENLAVQVYNLTKKKNLMDATDMFMKGTKQQEKGDTVSNFNITGNPDQEYKIKGFTLPQDYTGQDLVFWIESQDGKTQNNVDIPDRFLEKLKKPTQQPLDLPGAPTGILPTPDPKPDPKPDPTPFMKMETQRSTRDFSETSVEFRLTIFKSNGNYEGNLVMPEDLKDKIKISNANGFKINIKEEVANNYIIQIEGLLPNTDYSNNKFQLKIPQNNETHTFGPIPFPNGLKTKDLRPPPGPVRPPSVTPPSGPIEPDLTIGKPNVKELTYNSITFILILLEIKIIWLQT